MLADRVNISKSTLQRYETGFIRNMPVDKLEDIAKALSVKPAYLMGWSEDMMSVEGDNPDTSHTMKKVISRLPHFAIPVSAGNGSWLEEGYDYEWVEYEDAPKDADFTLTIKGDSMSPLYNDGEVVFIKQNRLVESGEVGIFLYNGDGYLKKLQGTKLMSLNSSYQPIEIGENDDFYTAGKVVGKQRA